MNAHDEEKKSNRDDSRLEEALQQLAATTPVSPDFCARVLAAIPRRRFLRHGGRCYAAHTRLRVLLSLRQKDTGAPNRRGSDEPDAAQDNTPEA